VDSPHRAIGLAIFILVTIHVTLAFYRPHLPKTVDIDKEPEAGSSTEDNVGEQTELEQQHDPNFVSAKTAKFNKPAAHSAVGQKSVLRSAWEICHRMFGVLLLSLAWFNCYTGLGEYEDAEEKALFSDQTCLLAVVGIIGSLMLIAFSAKSSMLL